MLSSSLRFHGHGSLNWAYRHGQVVRGQSISLKYALNSRRHSFRVSVVVSRKISRSAVVRNRIRRRVYEVVRLNADKIKGNFDLIISIHSEAVAKLSNKELKASVLDLLKRAKVI